MGVSLRHGDTPILLLMVSVYSDKTGVKATGLKRKPGSGIREWEPPQLLYKEVSALTQQPICICVCGGKVYRPSDSMRALVLFACLAVGCLAQRPQPCTSPQRLTGQFSVATQSEKLMAYARYSYDALGKRIHLREFGSHNNKTFHIDLLLLFKEGVMYKINYKNRTCCKKPLNADFHPLEVPQNATLLGQVFVGGSSSPRQGVLVNTWWGELQMKKGPAKYMSTVTEVDCIPVSTLFHTSRSGWMVTSFFNNVIGLVDPQHLIPPRFCTGAQLEERLDEEPVTFFSLF